ncbi:hypothetical protein GGI07_005859, partial [Coemansia sp. Benny D115]
MSRSGAAATQGRGSNMQNLLGQLKALESVRQEELVVLEGVNKLRLSSEATGNGDSKQSYRAKLGESCAAASELALKEKHLADAAIEYVNAMLTELNETDSAGDIQQQQQQYHHQQNQTANQQQPLEQLTKRRRTESQPGAMRRESRSRDRAGYRAGADSSEIDRKMGGVYTAELGRTQSLGISDLANTGSGGGGGKLEVVDRDRDRHRNRERERDRDGDNDRGGGSRDRARD